jgi:hypothetical protein
MTVAKSNFAFRIDRWDNNGNAIEHVAWIEDFDVALAAFRAACLRWLGESITLRQGARLIEDSRRKGLRELGQRR